MSSNLRALRKKRSELSDKYKDAGARAEAFLTKEGATAEDRAAAKAISDNERKPLGAEIDAFDERITLLEELQADQRSADLPVKDGVQLQATPGAERSGMLGYPSLKQGGAAAFALDVMKACGPGKEASQRLLDSQRMTVEIGAAPTGFQKTTGTEGYLIPPEMEQEIRRLVFEEDDILQMVAPKPTSSNSFRLLANEGTPWGAQGIKAYWTAEGAQKTTSSTAVEPRTGSLHKLAALVLATDEVLEDAPALQNLIMQEAPAAISWTASEAIMNGTGVGQPLGWRNSPALIQVAKETGQGADTIVSENIAKMFARLLVGPGSKVVWIGNRDIMPQVIHLRIGNEPSWTAQNQGLRDAPQGLLLGETLKWSEHASTLGDAGDIQLVNLAGYYAREKAGGIQFASSIHLYFDYDVSAFRWVYRLGGMPILGAVVTPAKGSATKSHWVELAARA